MGMKILERETNHYLAQLVDYYNSWGVEINTSKSEFLTILGVSSSYKNCRSYIPKIRLAGVELIPKNQVKYLGVTFDKKFTFLPHVQAICEKAKTAIALWSRALHSRSGLSAHVKKIIYMQVIRSILAYGYPVWFQISPSNMKTLNRIERRRLRKVTNLFYQRTNPDSYKRVSNQELYRASNIPQLCDFLASLGLQAINRLQYSENKLIEELLGKQTTLDTAPKYVPPTLFPTLYRKGFFTPSNKNFLYRASSL